MTLALRPFDERSLRACVRRLEERIGASPDVSDRVRPYLIAERADGYALGTGPNEPTLNVSVWEFTRMAVAFLLRREEWPIVGVVAVYQDPQGHLDLHIEAEGIHLHRCGEVGPDGVQFSTVTPPSWEACDPFLPANRAAYLPGMNQPLTEDSLLARPDRPAAEALRYADPRPRSDDV